MSLGAAGTIKGVAVLGAATLLVGCGTRGPTEHEQKLIDQVRSCITRGGEPVYTVDENGYVARFILCKEPPG